MAASGATLERSIGTSPEVDKRRQILDGARQVFMAAGFDGASMGEIARAAGVSKGTLYVYFDSKEALFEALTLEEKRSLAEALFTLDADDPDVAAVLTRLGTTYLIEMFRPEHVAVIRMVIGACEKFPHFGQAFFDAGPAQGVARLTAYLDAQVEAGRLTAADTDLAAKHFLHLCQAGLLDPPAVPCRRPVSEDEIATGSRRRCAFLRRIRAGALNGGGLRCERDGVAPALEAEPAPRRRPERVTPRRASAAAPPCSRPGPRRRSPAPRPRRRARRARRLAKWARARSTRSAIP